MQIAVIEFARDVCKLSKANSREFDPDSPYKVIDFLPDQNDKTKKGGTLRLGRYECLLQPNSRIKEQYGQPVIFERHRHRYEFNNDFRDILKEKGLRIGGTSPDGYIVETIELDHPYFIGVQFHPEFILKSGPISIYAKLFQT